MLGQVFRSALWQTLAFFLAATAFAQTPAKDRPLPPTEQPTAPVLAERSPLAIDDKEQPKLPQQIAIDFKNVFTTKENFWILSAGLGASLLATTADDGIPTSRFNSELYEGNGLDQVFESGEIVGGGLFQVGAAFTTFALGKATSSSEVAGLGRDLVRAQLVTQGLTQAVKHTVGRTRPDGSSNTSFPSGHSSGTFATATVLQRRYGWKVGLPAYGVAGFVAASRLSENKHYLSDVIFGATIGILVGRTVTLSVGDARFAVAPMIVPEGAGVQLALLP